MFRVEGFRVSGLRVEGFRVSGLRVGCRLRQDCLSELNGVPPRLEKARCAMRGLGFRV